MKQNLNSTPLKNEFKRCSKCGDIKPFGEFYKKRGGRDGISSWCKLCNKKNCQSYRLLNREHVREYRRKYQLLHKEYYKEYHRSYRLSHGEHFKESSRKYRLRNREQIKESSRKYYLENREKISELKKKHAKNLTNAYIRSTLTQESPILFSKDIPVELIEAKRLQLQIHRQLKEIKS